MQYEVEKRSKLSNQEEFDRVKSYLDDNAKFLGRKEMKSYLFQEPTFLRIRLISGNDSALITEKTGDYSEAGRPEKEHKISIEEIPAFVDEKNHQGYQRCSLVHTTRYSYKLNGLKVELNDIDYLGFIVEVEALTEDESEIPFLETQIRKTMKELQLQELDSKTYQSMMSSMYAETLKSVSEHTFII
ncbi:MAG: CYTH domain-containing protein [Patescibacteria group bacterium]